MLIQPVKIAGTGSYLPGAPITSDRLEAVLGRLEHAPRKVRNFVDNLGQRVLERGGIETRHLAVDPDSGNMTHTFSSLAEGAARNALDMAKMQPQKIELLIISCPSSDQSTPPTSALLQESLGIQTCAEMEIHSNCAGVGKAMQVAYDALRCGRYQTALVCYSQLSSLYLRSCYFNQKRMDKVNAALRWILADGAGAIVLQAGQNGIEGREVIGTYVESVGGGLPAGMTAGGGAVDLIQADHQIPGLYEEGCHHLWQDFNAVKERAARLLLNGVLRFVQQLGIPPNEVDHYVASIPTRDLYEAHIQSFEDQLGVGRERMKFRASGVGYCGGATPLLHLDEMVRSGELKPGQLVVVHAVESSKWMTAGFAVQW